MEGEIVWSTVSEASCAALLSAITDSECDVTLQPDGGFTVQVNGICYDYPDWPLKDAVCDAFNNWRSDRSYEITSKENAERRQAADSDIWRDGFERGFGRGYRAGGE